MKPFPNKFFPFLMIYIKAFKYQISFFLLLTLLYISLENIGIRLFADIIGAIKDNNDQSYSEAMQYVYLFIGCSLLTIFFNFYSTLFFNTKFLVPCTKLININLFEYLLGHSYGYITNKQSGMFITHMNQVAQLPSMLDIFAWTLQDIFDLLIKITLLALISPLIGGLYLVALIITFFTAKSFSYKVTKSGKILSIIRALISGRLLDTTNNINLVKQFDNIEKEKKSLNILLKQHFDSSIKNLKIFMSQFSLTGIISSIFSFLLIVFALYLWHEKSISTADLTFIIILNIDGLNMVFNIIEGVQRHLSVIVKIEKSLEIFSDEHEIVDKKNAKKLNVSDAKIEFRDICFTYKNKRKPVFNKFNLVINAGEKIGIVGESGSGKSTLVNLLQRAFELDSGKILIDDIDITDVTQESLHQNISIIPQDTVMFNRSIFQNITFGTNIRDINTVKNASKKAYADEFIMEKDGNYNSYAGDRGCKLSGGERQRLAIARAILKDAPILILDEATSSLDTQSEQLINKAIENVISKQTVIAIAHRLSTLKNMDRIIVLDKGNIVETGKFDELINKGGKFAKLYLAQQKKKGGKHA